MAETIASRVSHLDRGVDRRSRIVRVEQQRVAVVRGGDRLERLALRIEELDERVWHSPGRRQPEAERRTQKRRAEAAADARRARGHERVLGASQRELGHGSPAGRPHHATGFGRDQRGQVHRLQQAALEQQRFGKRSRNTQQGFVGEGDRAFGHGQDLAAEAQILQVAQEPRVVVADLLQEGEVFVGVVEAAHELERHLEASHEQVGSVEGRAARVQVEGGLSHASCPPGDVGGIGVIQVGQQARVVWRVRTSHDHTLNATARNPPGSG